MPTADEKETLAIGIIGMGEMGKMYAERLSRGGWKRINVCDIPAKFDQLTEEFKGKFLPALFCSYD